MKTKQVKIDGATFKASADGRVWIVRDADEIEIGTGTKGIYKKYFVKEINKSFYLHRIVATAFIPNPKNKQAVNHKDGDRFNNSSTNLEWVTHRENIAKNYARK